MATTFDTPSPRVAIADTRFFVVMAVVMSAIIVAGFSLNIAMGRSSFDLPLAYHVHGVIFMGWIALYLAQHMTIARGNIALHRRVGWLAWLWIPLMLAAGALIMVVTMRRTGGPFLFAQNEFFISNMFALLTFGWLALWALRRQRHTGWHRRLMLVAMSVLTGPGLGRLLPTPLFMPHAWTTLILITFVFPIIGMIADKRRLGHVHPAYWWGMAINVGLFAASMVLAYTPLGYAITEWIVAGTPGANRPVEAFLPPGFTM